MWAEFKVFNVKAGATYSSPASFTGLIIQDHILTFWLMTPHSPVDGYLCYVIFYPKDTAVMILWNTGNHIPEPTLFHQIPGYLPYNA